MASYPYLFSRNGHYYFRLAVPKALVGVMGMTELFYSLKTKNLTEARSRCLAMLEVSQELFRCPERLSAPLVKIALKNCLEGFSGKVPPIAYALPQMISEAGQGKLISLVFEEYLGECLNDRLKTVQTKRAILALWLDIVGDTPVKAIGKSEARDFKQVLMKLPSNLNKRFKGKSIKEIDLDAIPPEQRLSIKSININLGVMGSFVNWMINNGYYDSANPFSGLGLKDNERAIDKKLPFSKEQLGAIFNSPIYTGCKSEKAHDRYIRGDMIIRDGLYWVPLIALYSGARLQEICQLYVSDVKQIGDIWVFDFNTEGKDKQLKTQSSNRKTPIHPRLIELGLLQYWEEQRLKGKERLFSDLAQGKDGTYSSVFSKRFNHFIERSGIKTDRTSFHSFRHTFIDALRNTDVPREVREALVGHLNKKTAHDSYGSAIGIHRLYGGIIKLGFPSLYA